MVMDPNFKKILEQTNINNNKEIQLKEIKQRLNLSISYKKIKQILILIYGNNLKEIHKQNKIYFNIICTRNKIKTVNNIMFWELYNKEYIKNNFNKINDYFNLLTKNKPDIKKISQNIIYYCLCSGIPINAIAPILIYSSYNANSKQIKKIYNQKTRQFKKLNNYCSICGVNNNLELHHIEPISKALYLKYNFNNWIVLCTECHKKQHQK